MLRFNSHTIEASRALKKLTTGTRLQLHTSSKGHVDIELNFPSAVTKKKWK